MERYAIQCIAIRKPSTLVLYFTVDLSPHTVQAMYSWKDPPHGRTLN